jgi:Domain of unknown function (DUF4350)
MFPDRYVETVRTSFDKEWPLIRDYSSDNSYSLYFLIARNLVLTDEELKDFLAYVQAGNDLFISADYVDTGLLRNLNCNVERLPEIIDETGGIMRQTKVSSYFGDSIEGPSYSYYYYPFLNSLSGFDTAFARVLGVNDEQKPNYVIFFSGKGRIYLQVAPRSFSNYFLLKNDNYKYFEYVVSFLRSDPKNIYWDEFYKTTSIDRQRNRRRDADSFSSLSVINQNPPLLWAFWLAVAGMLIFLLFNFKRKQRMIPVVKPNVNTTLNFTETIGRLYLQKKDNKHIAEKMITYFFEYIRSKFFIGTAQIDETFVNRLSGKSGAKKEDLKNLVTIIEYVQKNEEVDDEHLLLLNSEIEKFYKNQR